MNLKYPSCLVWFRRDLRSFDHAALDAAVQAAAKVWCVFVFDRDILDRLAGRQDRRVEFIWHSVAELDSSLRSQGGGLIVLHDRAVEAIPRLAAQLGCAAVFANRDYEPQASQRDRQVAGRLQRQGCAWQSFKDQVILETDQVMSAAGRPFSVFTPYRNAWLKRLAPDDLRSFASSLSGRLAPPPAAATLPALDDLGFARTNLATLGIPTGMSGGATLFEQFRQRIGGYHETRDYPAVKGPSYLSVHLRFGTVSVRQLARFAHQAMIAEPALAGGARVWLSELIWREFYFQVLHHHPHVAQRAFKPEYDRIAWALDEGLLEAWRGGRTGYPLVDAAMAQINRTGYMHNRLRMVAASFLVKDLGIDWRRGEQYFADQLNDFDLAANNGGWQWAASSGCDAQPYFRIFNPVTQSRKFDPQGKFIRRYLPQLNRLSDQAIHAPWLASPAELAGAGIELGVDYPHPIVDHDQARKATLARYEVVKRH